MKSFEVKNKQLLYKGSNVSLPGDGSVSQYIEVESLFIVLFSVVNHPEINNNILAFDPSGKVKWQIQGQEPVTDLEYPPANYYTGVELNSQGNLIAWHCMDTDWKVDLNTGFVEPS